MLELQPPPAATSSPCATLRWALGREEAGGGFRSSSSIPTFKICQIIFLSEELSSKYISIFPDVFKYTKLEPRAREYTPYVYPRFAEAILFRDWHAGCEYRENSLDRQFPLRS